MNKPLLKAGPAAIALVLIACLLSGCQSWPPAQPVAEEEPGVAATQKPGRAKIKATGVDERSREIERSLGAR